MDIALILTQDWPTGWSGCPSFKDESEVIWSEVETVAVAVSMDREWKDAAFARADVPQPLVSDL